MSNLKFGRKTMSSVQKKENKKLSSSASLKKKKKIKLNIKSKTMCSIKKKIYIYIFNMAVEYEELKGIKPLNESKSRITEIKILEEDDDLNANYLSEEKELRKEHFSRIEEINEKIREICIKGRRM